ncbi:MAG: GGDEF domain-containing protein [Deltaproteobacteria bacterium]|nr:GGDEF domain-containing protein [Deltaproteobacteria bacterium]
MVGKRASGGLAAENAALRRALRLLSDVANLTRAAEDPEATTYAILTGVTAGVGLGLHRAMIFAPSPDEPGVLVGAGAIGPSSLEEADRVWRSIEASRPDLETLYEAGMRARAEQSPFDALVRATRIDVAARPESPVALAAEPLTPRECTDDVDGLFHLPTTLAAPMRGREGLRGVLVADNRWGGQVPDAVTQLVFGMVADHAGRALFAADRWAEVAREARVDALTGLEARRVGLAAIEHAASGALAGGESVALCLLDVDRFKRVNDEHGHPVGDAVLAEVAARVRAALARGERAFRYGGEEIGVIVPACDRETAIGRAQRVREAVGRAPVVVTESLALHVTCSAGVAVLEPGQGDALTLLRAADDALLRAKRAGRDRTEHA